MASHLFLFVDCRYKIILLPSPDALASKFYDVHGRRRVYCTLEARPRRSEREEKYQVRTKAEQGGKKEGFVMDQTLCEENTSRSCYMAMFQHDSCHPQLIEKFNSLQLVHSYAKIQTFAQYNFFQKKRRC
jgi:hypothetical protein